MKPTNYLAAFSIAVMFFISSCGEKEKAGSVAAEIKKAVPAAPFPFYKNIEIRPGLNFEIIAWEKGADSEGGYTILLSDSLRNNYKAVAGERKDIFKDAWNMDLDTDGDPELYIQLLRNKNESDLIVYEFFENEFHKINFPSLSSRTRKIFKGNDKFFIQNGELFRSIPMADPSGKTVVKNYRYVLQGNAFEIKEVKE